MSGATTSSPNKAPGGAVTALLRAEGLAILILCTALYARTGMPWWLFGALFLAPDIAFLGYLPGPRAGAVIYNAMHSTLGPVALYLAAFLMQDGTLEALALIWGAHVGFDRALGYGLKYGSAFRDTHLGRIGRD